MGAISCRSLLLVVALPCAMALACADDRDAYEEHSGAAANATGGAADGPGGTTTVGGTITEAGASASPASSGAVGAEGGAESPGAGASGAGGEGGAGGEPMLTAPPDCAFTPPGGAAGELLFDAPCGAKGRELFRVADHLFWRYELRGRSYMLRGSLDGSEREVVAVSDAAVSMFDVRGAIAYQTGSQIFARPLGFGRTVSLPDAPLCSALSSTTQHVYCKTYDETIVRWPVAGGASSVVAELQSGPELIADERSGKLIFQGVDGISTLPLGGGTTPELRFPLGFGGAFGSPYLFALRLMPGDYRLFWVAEGVVDSFPSTIILTTFAVGSLDPSITSGMPATRSIERPNSRVDRDFIPPVYTPFPPWGSVLASGDYHGGAELVPSGPYMDLGYTSADGMASLTADAEHVLWQDGKGRVFRGAPEWPEVGSDDGFESTLDDRAVSSLTPAEAETYCEELVAYVNTVSDEDARRAACSKNIRLSGEFDASTCETQAQECATFEDDTWSKNLTHRECVTALTDTLKDCSAPAKSFASCAAERADYTYRYVGFWACDPAPDAPLPPASYEPLFTPSTDCPFMRARCPHP